MKNKYSFFRKVAVMMAFVMMWQVCHPTVAWALTSGPSQPEVQSFEPASTTDMVDIFTGDFNYNIPLFELPGPNGGYPFNIAYHSGVTMDQEASWVGLGWNINPGVLNRDIRGVPDDFNGDKIHKKKDMKDNWSVGVGGGINFGIFGGEADKGTKGILGGPSIGMQVFYNSYRGVGIGIDAGVGYHCPGKASGLGLNLGLSLNSQEGATLSPSISLSDVDGETTTTFSAGIGFNSQSGVKALTLGLSVSNTHLHRHKDPKRAFSSNHSGKGSVGGSSPITFANPGYTPAVMQQMTGGNLSGSFKGAAGFCGVYTTFYVNGYYSIQKLKEKNFDVSAYGYLNLHNASDNAEKQMMDFNRHGDGLITSTTPNLPMPNLTYDAYNAVGQGISGMFRPYRSDVSVVYDPKVRSTFGGGSLGGDVGPTHFGISGAINVSNSYSEPWLNGLGTGILSNPTRPVDYEQAFYSVLGEYTSEPLSAYDYMGGDEVVRLAMQGGNLKNEYVTKEGSSLHSSSNNIVPSKFHREERKPRNMGILPIYNKDITDDLGNVLLPEFNVKYYTSPDLSTEENINRKFRYAGASPNGNSISDHIGGFSSVNADGMRYIYALPIYNTYQSESVFSCEDNQNGDKDGFVKTGPTEHRSHPDKFLDETQMPPYAYSYLLTAIVGPDYVDVDNNGPSENDFGYWVKFNYFQAYGDGEDAYKWRAPYTKANFMRNSVASYSDNRGSYMYGEKEIYYLASAETKTHISYFNLDSDRDDALGAKGQYENNDPGNQTLYKLHDITLHSKDAAPSAPPLVKIKMEYTQELCPKLPNALNEAGKLTLKELSFEYEGSGKGALTPYEFGYSAVNPEYNTHAQDRWSMYKPLVSGKGSTYYLDDIENRYTTQFDNVDPVNFRNILHQNAHAWQLVAITTPSGAEINVEYELDDYAYVQDKVAGQMFKIAGFYPFSQGPSYNSSTIYLGNYDHTNNAHRKVYFELEKVRDPNTVNDYVYETDINKYLVGIDQVFIKIKVFLKDPGDAEEDYVSGYFDIMDGNRGVETISGSQYGYVTLKKVDLEGATHKFHPVALACWQHLRNNLPELTHVPGGIAQEPGSSNAAKAAKIKGLLSVFGSIRDLFRGYYSVANSQNWARSLGHYGNNYSFIRLTTPDKVKYGGGTRVKKLTLSDGGFGSEAARTYGQVYDYTTTEAGYPNPISSGVAQYEPMVGGDENIMRHAKKYPHKVSIKVRNSLFFEYPINESYFPGPHVGYSKVTVHSLATSKMGGELPTSMAGTGKTVYDFYTAKDYPVVTDETTKEPYQEQLQYLPVLFLGTININHIALTQGYKIELNDMHGKPKMVSNYGMDATGKMLKEPYSWVSYKYFDKEIVKDGNRIKVLDNKFRKKLAEGQYPILSKTGDSGDEGWEIGTNYDFFTDVRHNKSSSGMGGLNFNTDLLPIPIPIPTIWPNIDYSSQGVKMAVSNKIIHRAGIMESVTAFDGQATITTANKYFDAVSGRPIVTVVNNSFDDFIYSYEQPAHWAYKGMGPAYENLGLKANVSLTFTGKSAKIEGADFTKLKDYLISGDELVVNHTTSMYKSKYKAYVNLVDNTSKFIELYFPNGNPGSGSGFELLVTRSGKRNLITASSAKYVTLNSDPIFDRTEGECSQNLNAPVMEVGYHTIQQPVVTQIPCTTVTGQTVRVTEAATKTIELLDLMAKYYTAQYSYNKPTPDLFVTMYNIATANIYYRNLYESKFNHLKNLSSATACGQFTGLYLSLQNIAGVPASTPCGKCETLEFAPPLPNGPGNTPTEVFVFSSDHVIPPLYYRLNNRSIWGNNRYAPWTSWGRIISFTELDPYSTNPNDPYKHFAKVKVTYGNGLHVWAVFSTAWCLPATEVVDVTIVDVCEETTYVPVYVPYDYVGSQNENICIPFSKMNNVLEASAVEYSDCWVQDFKNVRFNITSTDPAFNTYQKQLDYLRGVNNDKDARHLVNGIKGTWRPFRSYVYVDEREQSSLVKVDQDGVFNNVPVYNQAQPLFANCEETNRWTLTSTVNRYSPYSFETENYDVLNRYSAALYGYQGKLTTAVASNATYWEIGCEGFEEGFGNHEGTSTCNMRFTVENSTLFSSTYIDYKVIAGRGNVVFTDMPYSFATQNSNRLFMVNATLVPKGCPHTPAEQVVKKVSVSTINNINGYAALILESGTPGFSSDNDDQLWKGTISVPRQFSTFAYTSPSVEITSEKAHTGKNSLKVNANTAWAQHDLRLKPNTRYWISAWVSNDFTTIMPPPLLNNFAQNEGAGIEVTVFERGVAGIMGNYRFTAGGEAIDGWRRIEGTFTTPHLTTGTEFTLTIGLNRHSMAPLYFDDIRIQPFESSMQTYVYDPENHKLVATLDENNFATLYSYDKQGNLFLVKKETEKGIMTVQQSRTHIKE